ncbi:MAG: Rne/Rng family ribonuclease, partial [Syntrophorhabdaceae bacterium]|nr:Rne/Rng family ribonuclease [Syntrophorhabdaceae bacterium]
ETISSFMEGESQSFVTEESALAPTEASASSYEESALGASTLSETTEQKRNETGKKRRRRRRRRKGKGDRSAENEADIQAGEESAGCLEDELNDIDFAEAEMPEEFSEDSEDETAEEDAAEDGGNGPRKVMLIDGMHSEENRVAIVVEGLLEYYEVENQRKKAFKGNIYKGKVVNIAPAIDAAFVEFGGGRHGFLPMNEYCAGALMDNLETWREGDKRPPLRPGMELLVQVTKEESVIKGAALTSYISIAGRYMVMMLGMKRYGISKKITGEKERERIRKQMEKLEYPEHLGFIVRTVGAARPLKDLRGDLQSLLKLWNRTVTGAQENKAPTLLYEEQDIVIRALRDNYSADVAEVLMNSEATLRKAESFFDVYFPQQKNKLKLYRQKRPLFARFNLEEQVERVIARKVPLPSGGHIVIDRTEAIWTIDVNSGRSSRDRDIEDTAFRTNREAATEAARQMRIRDIGGLIVVDFIDMENKSHNKEIEQILKEVLKKDKAKSDFTSLGKFGLVAISRQRMGISFYDILLKRCEACAGLGVAPTRDSSAVRLFRRLHDELTRDKKDGPKDIFVRVSTDLLETLINQKRDEITRIERMCGGKVTIHADSSLPRATFVIGAPDGGAGTGTR